MRRVFLPLALAAFVLSPAAGAGSERTSHSCLRGGELRFSAADGTKLVAHRFGKGPTAVILGHQSGGDLCEWLPYAKRLASKGYFVFAIDFRGHGLSQVRTGKAENRLAADLAAAAKEVRKLGKRKVFLVGASMGGIASLVAGANVKPAVDGVVSISAPARFLGLDAVASAPRLRVPVLYVAAEGDDNAGYDFSEDARDDARCDRSGRQAARDPPGGLHGVGLVAGSARVKTLGRRRSCGRLDLRQDAEQRLGGVRAGGFRFHGIRPCADGTAVEPVRCTSEGVRDSRAGRAPASEPVCGCRRLSILLQVGDDLVEKLGGEVHVGLLTRSTCVNCSKLIEQPLPCQEKFATGYAASVRWLSNVDTRSPVLDLSRPTGIEVEIDVAEAAEVLMSICVLADSDDHGDVRPRGCDWLRARLETVPRDLIDAVDAMMFGSHKVAAHLLGIVLRDAEAADVRSLPRAARGDRPDRVKLHLFGRYGSAASPPARRRR